MQKLPHKLLDVSINKIWCTIVEFASVWVFDVPEGTHQARIDFIITHAVADVAFVDCLYQYFDRIVTIMYSSHQIVFRANPITGLFIKPSEAVRHVLPHIRITLIKYKLQSMLDQIVSVKDKLLEKETITGEEFAVEIGIIRDLL